MISNYFYRFAASPTHISKLIPQLDKGETKLREISKEIGMQYSHLSRCMQEAHKEGLIDRKRQNNKWEFKLTEKGKAMCAACKMIKVIIEDYSEKTPGIMLNILNKDLKLNEEKAKESNTIKKQKEPKKELEKEKEIGPIIKKSEEDNKEAKANVKD